VITETLTGRIRHRLQTGLFSKPIFILQVEVRRHGRVYSADPGDFYSSDIDETIWRDAKFEDLAVIYG
jgi:hypothetical protein